MTTAARTTTWQAWLPEGVLATVVLLAGVAEAGRGSGTDLVGTPLLVVLATAAAVLLSRHAPGLGLALVWVVGGLQVVTGTEMLAVQGSVAVVAFGCARWGSRTVVLVSGVSIPAAAAAGGLLVLSEAWGFFSGIEMLQVVRDSRYAVGNTLLVGAVSMGLLVLAVPWLLGLALRATTRARGAEVSQVAAEEDAARAHRDASQAQEIAGLRAEQARLARDVHDVVGHSLAVILAQAESAQFLPDDPGKLKSTLATIATSARTSLQDVRQVLSATPATVPARPGGLETLVAGIRASGQEVLVDEVGAPQPLPPELEVVAYRVVQEMLTNAVKHGRRDRPIRLERHWPDGAVAQDLRIEVSNSEAALDETQPIATGPVTPDAPAGQGLDGMRRRVASVGGRLDVRRRADADGATFTATAWVPVRSGSMGA